MQDHRDLVASLEHNGSDARRGMQIAGLDANGIEEPTFLQAVVGYRQCDPDAEFATLKQTA